MNETERLFLAFAIVAFLAMLYDCFLSPLARAMWNLARYRRGNKKP